MQRRTKRGLVIGVVVAILLLLWWTLGREPAPEPTAAVVTRALDAGAAPAPDAQAEDTAEVTEIEPAPDPEPTPEVTPQREPTTLASRSVRAPPAIDAGELAPDAEPEEAGARDADTADAEPPPDASEAPTAQAPEQPSPFEVRFIENVAGVKATLVEVISDGKVLGKKANPEGIETGAGIALYSGALPAGTHHLAIRVKMIGESAVFSYLEAYAFTLKQKSTLRLAGGKKARVVITALAQGDVTRQWQDRMTLKVDIESPP